MVLCRRDNRAIGNRRTAPDAVDLPPAARRFS
jgi:hypothetical protein